MSDHNSSILFGIVLFLALIALLPFASHTNGNKPDKVVEDKKPERFSIISHEKHDGFYFAIIKDTATGKEYLTTSAGSIILIDKVEK